MNLMIHQIHLFTYEDSKPSSNFHSQKWVLSYPACTPNCHTECCLSLCIEIKISTVCFLIAQNICAVVNKDDAPPWKWTGEDEIIQNPRAFEFYSDKYKVLNAIMLKEHSNIWHGKMILTITEQKLPWRAKLARLTQSHSTSATMFFLF